MLNSGKLSKVLVVATVLAASVTAGYAAHAAGGGPLHKVLAPVFQQAPSGCHLEVEQVIDESFSPPVVSFVPNCVPENCSEEQGGGKCKLHKKKEKVGNPGRFVTMFFCECKGKPAGGCTMTFTQGEGITIFACPEVPCPNVGETCQPQETFQFVPPSTTIITHFCACTPQT